jgi:RNA polymerase sigma-70 factor (ECF subfamily)
MPQQSAKQRSAFEKDALPHLDALYGMAVRLTGNERDAEDLVQDTMVKAFRFFHRFQPGSNIKAWLFKVLVNTFYNTVRKHKNVQRLHAEAGEMDGHLDLFLASATTAGRRAEDELLDRLAAEEIRSAMEELPDEFRLAVILSDVHDFTYKEISEIIGCPVGTVMSRLHRGRRLLQRRLYEYAVEQGYIEPVQREGSGTADLEAYRRERARRRKEGK